MAERDLRIGADPLTARVDDAAQRARAWWHGMHASVCDVIEPWAHGTIVRATRFPTYYGFNLVRVEEDPGPAVGADELIAVADQALAGYEHRRIDIEAIEFADRVRPEFEARGWNAMRVVWMLFDGDPPPAELAAGVEQVPYEAVGALRSAWHEEDHPGQDEGDFPPQQRAVAELRDAQVLAMFSAAGEPIAFAQLERTGTGAEISHVYVHPDHRGAGRGTAITAAAILAGLRDADDLWITADDEYRAKEIYARLGFRPVWRTMDLTRWPSAR